MENLTFNQKLILGGIIILFIAVVGYYILGRETKQDYSELEMNYLDELSSNEVSDESKATTDDLVVHIAGEVLEPGIVKVPSGSRITDVIEAAGGLSYDADLSSVNLAYPVLDGQKIYIPSLDDEGNVSSYITSENGSGIIADSDATSNSSSNLSVVNINTANQTLLETLPGIGPSTALKIIEYRKQQGKFSSIEEIKQVSGIGDAKFNNIKDKITI